MKKRIVSLFVVLTMLSALFAASVAVSADGTVDAPTGWTKGASQSTTEAQRNSCFILSSDEALSGRYSLKISKQDPQMSNQQIYLRNYSVKGLEAGEYTVSINMKGVPESEGGGNHQPGINVVFEYSGGEAKSGLQWWKAWGWSRTALENGWYRFEKTFTTAGAATQFYMELFEVPDDMYIDDIAITKSGDERNLLDYGGFEPNSYAANTIPYGWSRNTFNASADQLDSSMELSDVIALSGKNSLRVKQQTLSNVQIYLRNNFDVPAETGEYTLTLYTKGSNAPCMNACLDGANLKRNLQYSYDPNYGITRTELPGGWFKFETVFTATNPITQFNFELYDAPNEFFIDDVSLVKTGSTENILKNGGFEKAEAKTNTYPSNTLPTGTIISANNVEDYENGNFFTVTDEDAYDGKNSLKLKSGEMSFKQVYLRNAMETSEPGEYDITFYMKGAANPHFNIYMINGSGSLNLEGETFANSQASKCRTTAADGWRKYSFTQTLEKESSHLEIQLFSTADVLIDNMSVVKKGTDKNLLTNGSFEDAYLPEYTVSKVYVGDDYAYKVSARNNTLEKLNVMLTVATYVLNDDGEKVLYGAATDAASLGRGEDGVLSVMPEGELIPDDDVYYIKTFVWDSSTLMPFCSMEETRIDM